MPKAKRRKAKRMPKSNDKEPSEKPKQDAEGEEDEDDEEIYIVELDGVDYYTNDDENGNIYKMMEDEDIGPKVGEFKNGEAVLYEE